MPLYVSLYAQIRQFRRRVQQYLPRIQIQPYLYLPRTMVRASGPELATAGHGRPTAPTGVHPSLAGRPDWGGRRRDGGHGRPRARRGGGGAFLQGEEYEVVGGAAGGALRGPMHATRALRVRTLAGRVIVLARLAHCCECRRGTVWGLMRGTMHRRRAATPPSPTPSPRPLSLPPPSTGHEQCVLLRCIPPGTSP